MTNVMPIPLAPLVPVPHHMWEVFIDSRNDDELRAMLMKVPYSFVRIPPSFVSGSQAARVTIFSQRSREDLEVVVHYAKETVELWFAWYTTDRCRCKVTWRGENSADVVVASLCDEWCLPLLPAANRPWNTSQSVFRSMYDSPACAVVTLNKLYEFGDECKSLIKARDDASSLE